jgi:hypothetical protein
MSKKISSADEINDTTLHELLLMMDARLKHIEDIEADNRDIIIKLVKQGNQIVKFLSSVDIEDVTDEFENITSPPMSETEKLRSNKMQELKELVDDFMDRQQDLKEFEEELEKNKDKLTPGQIGES